MKRVDITNVPFGRLTPLEYVGLNKHFKALWRCICSCGNETIVSYRNMKTGNTTSCGCAKHDRMLRFNSAKSKDMTDCEVGRLKVIARAPNKGTAAAWLCKCRCGNETTVRGNALRRIRTLSCGCLGPELSSVRNSTHGLDASPPYLMWNRANHRSKVRNVPFDLVFPGDMPPTPEYCPILGLRLKRLDRTTHDASPSLDRIVPSLGYVRGNVRIISYRANVLKRDATFIELAAVLADLQRIESGSLVAISDGGLVLSDSYVRYKHPLYSVWHFAKYHAKRKNLPFDLKFPADIPQIPDVCPILGLSLMRGTGLGGASSSSPSLDKMIPSLGYVKGNVRFISRRANELKSNATVDELTKILADLQSIEAQMLSVVA